MSFVISEVTKNMVAMTTGRERKRMTLVAMDVVLVHLEVTGTSHCSANAQLGTFNLYQAVGKDT